MEQNEARNSKRGAKSRKMSKSSIKSGERPTSSHHPVTEGLRSVVEEESKSGLSQGKSSGGILRANAQWFDSSNGSGSYVSSN